MPFESFYKLHIKLDKCANFPQLTKRNQRCSYKKLERNLPRKLGPTHSGLKHLREGKTVIEMLIKRGERASSAREVSLPSKQNKVTKCYTRPLPINCASDSVVSTMHEAIPTRRTTCLTTCLILRLIASRHLRSAALGADMRHSCFNSAGDHGPVFEKLHLSKVSPK